MTGQIAMVSPNGRPCTVDNESGAAYLESLGFVRESPISETGEAR
jgi:hypothetical protein